MDLQRVPQNQREREAEIDRVVAEPFAQREALRQAVRAGDQAAAERAYRRGLELNVFDSRLSPTAQAWQLDLDDGNVTLEEVPPRIRQEIVQRQALDDVDPNPRRTPR